MSDMRRMAGAVEKLATSIERVADFLDHIRAREEARDEKYAKEEAEEAARNQARGGAG